jgi:hypothetical protein
LQAEAAALNKQLDEVRPRFEQACGEVAGLRELSGKRAKTRLAMRANAKLIETPDIPDARKGTLQSTLNELTNRLASLDAELGQLTSEKPDAKKALVDREKLFGQLSGNREKQSVPDAKVKTRGKDVQFWQEMGGLFGRIALAVLLAAAISKGVLLRIFQIPGLIVLPLTYGWLFQNEPALFQWGVAVAGFLTVAQFSYFGEYLPRVFPLHLRGTGGSFATNVGGRMLGTSAAFVTTSFVAPMLGGQGPMQVAMAAAIVGTAMFILGLGLSFLLPEPKEHAEE